MGWVVGSRKRKPVGPSRLPEVILTDSSESNEMERKCLIISEVRLSTAPKLAEISADECLCGWKMDSVGTIFLVLKIHDMDRHYI